MISVMENESYNIKYRYQPVTLNQDLSSLIRSVLNLIKVSGSYFVEKLSDANCYLESIELKGKIVALFGVLGREA